MRTIALAASLAGLCAGVATAQEGGLIIDRDRADRRAPGVELEGRNTQRAQPEANTPRAGVAPFELRGVTIEGASLRQAEANAAIAPLIGQRFDGANIDRIAEAIATAYRQSDIALYSVEVPDQDFSSGTVRVRVREGHVAAVSIIGETRGDLELVRRYGAALSDERPLSRGTMERYISLISDIPGLETTVTMSRADANAGVRLGLALDRRPWEYEIGINNRGSDALGETQLSATIVRNGGLRMGDQTRLTLAADSGFERFWLAGLSHRQPLSYDGAAISGSVSTLRTEPESGGEGRADSASLIVTWPWLRSYSRNFTVSAGLDGVNSDNAILGDIVASERVRVLRGSAAYVDANARRAWVLGVTLSQGLDGLGAEALDPSTTLDFTKLNLQVTHVRSLSRAFVIRLSAGGQWAGEALPASERFTLGGANYGRGFPAAETSGDDGLGASGELAWRSQWRWLPEAYVFADGGRVWTADRISGPGAMRDIASAGAGVRLSLPHETRLDLELAKPIDAAIPGDEAEGWRFRFDISARL